MRCHLIENLGPRADGEACRAAETRCAAPAARQYRPQGCHMTPTSPDDPTLAYYEDQAQAFFAETVPVDMASLYARMDKQIFSPAKKRVCQSH
jgi:hypothetical protein